MIADPCATIHRLHRHNAAVSEVDATRASEIERIFHAGIAEIKQAREAAAQSLSSSGRIYFRGVADDIARYLAETILRIRPRSVRTDGHRVPPPLSELHSALAVRLKLIEAQAIVQECAARLNAAWDAPCGSPEWSEWEALDNELTRAENRLDALEREAFPWL